MRSYAIVVFAAFVLASCGEDDPWAGNNYEAHQVYLMAPSSIVAGETATWEATWEGGTAPYTVYWDFGGGASNPGTMATSNNSLNIAIEMRAGEDGSTRLTATVAVTDSLGVTGDATADYQVTSPVSGLGAYVSSSTDHTLEIQVIGGTAPYTVRVSDPEGLITDTTELTTEDGSVVFPFYTVDVLLGGGGLCFIEVEDSLGFTYETDTFIGIDAVPLNDDTLYAIPLKHEVKVGEPVTILIATGTTAHAFQFLLGVGLVAPSDGYHDSRYPQTLNAGTIGNPDMYPDGIWGDIFPGDHDDNHSPFITGNAWDWIYPGADSEDKLGTENRWDINISPLGGRDVPSVKGSICSLGFEFKEPGLKRIGFQEFNGVYRTYYNSKAAGTDTFTWSVLMADEMGNLHPSVVGQVDNTILVTE